MKSNGMKKEDHQWYQTSFFSFSLKQECERIQFNCEKEIVETRQQVKEIIVSLNSIDWLRIIWKEYSRTIKQQLKH
jgi:hypothetical protein